MEFFKKHKYEILLTIFIVSIIGILSYIFYPNNTNYELLEPQTTKQPDLFETIKQSPSNYIVSLRYDKKIGDHLASYYIALVPKKECPSANSTYLKDCHKNIAILQSNKNSYAMFKLNKINENPEKYTLTSIISLQTPISMVLSQNINFYMGCKSCPFTITGIREPYMCFDSGSSNETNFELDKTDQGYLIKFKKDETYYYLSECRTLCGTNVRVCVDKNKDKGIPFNFEISEIPLPVPETKTQSIKSNQTLNTSSAETYISLPGADNMSYQFDYYN